MPKPKVTNRPTKLPPNYIPRTLARLLPSPSIIAGLSKEELIKLSHKKSLLEKEIVRDPSRFWIPNPGGQEQFALEEDPKARVFLYIAGNKSGKTTAGAIKLLERAYGKPIWGRDYRTYKARTPSRTVCFAEDFDTHRETTLPTLQTWAIPGTIRAEKKNPQGHVIELEFDNGSIMFFRTYDQGSDKAEGKDWDAVWFDEPPPRDVYTAAFRGVVVSNGFMLCTATLLKEVWLFDESIHPFVRVFTGEIHDNKWLSEDAKRDFLATLDDYERLAREKGKPISISGLVYREFLDDEPYVIPIHEVPPNAPIIMGVDPHERKPLCALYGYLTEEDEIVWFDYARPTPGPLREIFSQLREVEAKFPSKPCICIMDPNRGPAKQIDGISWMESFEEEGYYVVLGEDDITSGHTAVRSYLSILEQDTPRMVWMETCRGKHGPIWQMLRYSWEDDKNARRMGKDPREKPKQANKDFPDIIRYTAKLSPVYSVLVSGYPEIDRSPGWSERARDNRRVRAYG